MSGYRFVNIALLLWGGVFCLMAAFCLSLGKEYNREKKNWMIWMQLTTAVMMVCDALGWFVQGMPGAFNRFLMYFTNFLVYTGLYAVLFFFHRYTGCYLFPQPECEKPRRSFCVEFVCAIGILLVFLSQFSSMYYYIDAQNVYHRSKTFPLSMLLLLVGMLLELSLLVEFRTRLTWGRMVAMCFCILLPFSVSAVQMVHADISLIDIALGVSMITLFVVASTSLNMELAEAEKAKEQIRERLEIATTLNNCVGKLSSNNDINVGINNLLESIDAYFRADRTYIFEIDFARNVLVNTYEYVRGQDVTAQKDNLQEVPVGVIDEWMKSFRQGKAYYVPDLEQERGLPSYEMLQEQQVTRLLAVPLLKDNKTVIGFLGVDNPTEHCEDATLLASIQFFVTNSLERKKQQQYLEKLSYRDMLTGLYNRNKYIEVLEMTRKTQPQQVGAMYIDLNGLKRVNDQFGHRAGDELIVRAAMAAAEVFAEDVYRVGGDEFVVLRFGITQEEFAVRTDQLREKMRENQVNASIGTVWRETAGDLEELLRCADESMYGEKKQYYCRADAEREKAPVPNLSESDGTTTAPQN